MKNELRVGNWINSADSGNAIICTIGDTDCSVTNDNKESLFFIKHERLQPIPLTPEVLEKAGFEKSKTEYLKGLPNFEWLSVDIEQSVCVVLNKHLQISFVPFDQRYSLHWLQNLYFALTGEELEIKLNT